MIQVGAFIESTQRATTREGVLSCFSEAVQDEGYDNFVIARVENGAVSDIVADRLPAGYADAYFAENWSSIDPILAHTKRSSSSFSWNELIRRQKHKREEKNFLRLCRELGVHSGYTVPLHSPLHNHDIVSISVRDAIETDRSRLPVLHAISVQTWARLSEFDNDNGSLDQETHCPLTRRELEVLAWCKEGKSYWTIGQLLSISEKTVGFHMSNCFRKLEVSNQMTAVVVAIQRGWLQL